MLLSLPIKIADFISGACKESNEVGYLSMRVKHVPLDILMCVATFWAGGTELDILSLPAPYYDLSMSLEARR